MKLATPAATDKILLAANELPQPFTVEDLIVAAWRRWPSTFGLKGHAEYPDSNKILAALMGERGLVRRGWLTRVERRLYRVRMVEPMEPSGEAV